MKYSDVKVTNSIKYVGVNDHDLDLFEGQYIIPNGVAYNSYVRSGRQNCRYGYG